MKLPENDQQDYYNQKQVKRLESFKTDVKAIIVVIIIGVGYWSYLHNHFLAFFLTTFILGVYYLIYKFFKGVGRRNEAYDNVHKYLDKK